MTQRGKLIDRDVHFVNTGTWLRTETQGKTGYGERAGYAPVALTAPVVRVEYTGAVGNHIDVQVMV